ncbi:MAG: DUF951 family protein [Bacillales bacterium]|nr:DUF951 family protein [Mollicutes bacterium]MCI7212943.1 DUF951 family protein [Bacillales bacterium]MDY3903587.1 DUF951 domain-containing protein [Candidatus Enteromonas sp.]MCI7058185.1 DUF951 family protein [Mollicutes bacterium]MDD7714704.1 DUF951 domain-containing protein [Mollicutes bacterium]
MDVSSIKLYDEVEMKRPHPCSSRSKRFQVIRLGADVKILCLGCGNVIMLDRDKFNSKIKKVIAHHDAPVIKSV